MTNFCLFVDIITGNDTNQIKSNFVAWSSQSTLKRNESVRMYIPSPIRTKGKIIFPVWRILDATRG